MIYAEDPLVWGAARMMRVATEQGMAGRKTPDACEKQALVVGQGLRRALLDEGLSDREITSIAAALIRGAP